MAGPSGDQLVGSLRVPVHLDTGPMERAAKNELKRTAEKLGGQGGASYSKAFVQEIEKDFKVRKGDAMQAFVDGNFSRQDMERESRKAARRFNEALSKEIKRQADAGTLDTDRFIGLSSQFKEVGEEAGEEFSGGLQQTLRRGVAAALAFLASAGIVQQLREWGRAGVEATNSLLRLNATSKLFGVQQSLLNDLVRQGREEYKLSLGAAADLASSTSKLAARAGDAAQSQQLLAAALDLGAAQGFTAQQVAVALEQTLRGLDEGTDKLLQKNPAQVYAEYAAQIGKTAASLTDVEQKQALVNALLTSGARVQGEYTRQLDTDVGRLRVWSTLLEDSAQAIGVELVPILADLADLMEGPLRRGVDLFTAFLDRIDRIGNSPLENLLEDMRAVGAEAREIARVEAQVRVERAAAALAGARGESQIVRAPFGTADPLGRPIGQARIGSLPRFDVSEVTTDQIRSRMAEIRREMEGLASADGQRSETLRIYHEELQAVLDAREEEIRLADELKAAEENLANVPLGTGAGGSESPSPPTTPDPNAEKARQRLGALQRQLQDRLAALTASAEDDLLLQIERMEQEIREAAEKAGQAIPEGVLEGLDRLRADAAFQERVRGLRQDLQTIADAPADQDSQADLDRFIQKLREELDAVEDGSAAQEVLNGLLREAQRERERNAKAIEDEAEAAEKAAEKKLKAAQKAREEEERRQREQIRDLRDRARLLEENARAALQVAEALGLISDETAQALESLAQLGGSVARIAGGDLTAIPSAIGAVASLVGSVLGGDDAEELRRQMIENARRTAENTQALKDFTERALSGITGQEREAILETGRTLLAAMPEVLFGELTNQGKGFEALQRLATRTGLPLADIIAFFEQLEEITGLEFFDAEKGVTDFEAFGEAWEAFQEKGLGSFDEGVIGTIEALTFKWGIMGDAAGTAAEKVQDFIDVLAGTEDGAKFAEELQKALEEGGPEAANALIDSWAQRFAAGDQSLFEPGGLFAGLSADEVQRLLEEGNSLIEELLQGEGARGSSSFVEARSITDVRGSRIEGALFSQLAQDAERNELLRQLLASNVPANPAGALGASPAASYAQYTPGASSGVTVNVGPVQSSISIQNGGTKMDDHTVSAINQQGRRQAEEMSREIARQVKSRLQAQGRW